jgi:hypothetical protein
MNLIRIGGNQSRFLLRYEAGPFKYPHAIFSLDREIRDGRA